MRETQSDIASTVRTRLGRNKSHLEALEEELRQVHAHTQHCKGSYTLTHREAHQLKEDKAHLVGRCEAEIQNQEDLAKAAQERMKALQTELDYKEKVLDNVATKVTELREAVKVGAQLESDVEDLAIEAKLRDGEGCQPAPRRWPLLTLPPTITHQTSSRS